jgi:glutathione S-transferase
MTVQAWTALLDQALRPNVRLLGWHNETLPAMSDEQREDFLSRAEAVSKPQVMAGWAQVTSDAEASEDQLANARERIGDVVTRIEVALQDRDWLVGGEYSVVDINAFALTHTLPRLTPELANEAKTPKLMAWLGRVGERTAVQNALTMRRTNDDLYAPVV